jgi:uncharacterized membrane protein
MAHGVYKNMKKSKLKVHAILLSVAFMNIFLVVMTVLALVVLILSFALWVVPTIPTPETIGFAFRVVLAVTAVLTALYSTSQEYQEAITHYLAK